MRSIFRLCGVNGLTAATIRSGYTSARLRGFSTQISGEDASGNAVASPVGNRDANAVLFPLDLDVHR